MVGKIKLTESALRKLIREAVAGDPGEGVPGLLGKLLSMRWNQDRGSMWDTIKVVDLKGMAPDRMASIAEDVRAYNTAVSKMNAALDGGEDWGEEADLAERKLGDIIERLTVRGEAVGAEQVTFVYVPDTREIHIMGDDTDMTLVPGDGRYDEMLAKFN